MKKYLLLVILALGLVGCEPKPPTEKTGYILPPEMEHCKVYKLFDGDRAMRVVHCPLSLNNTSCYSSGKTTECVTVIQDPLLNKELEEYERLKAKYD